MLFRSDAVHTPIPGDVGTIGMILALVLRKPLFVRHCGNWFVQRTLAERGWKWVMERFAGGRNVMLATGGADRPPSKRNPNVRWIFSTSLTKQQMGLSSAKTLPDNRSIRLAIACRQEKRKGTDVAIRSLALLADRYDISLDVIGGGSLLDEFKQLALTLGLQNRVRFHGKVSQSRVVEILGDSHIFCYPTQASEGFPKVVLEAIANGLPVITTRVSVLPQLVEACGLLVDDVSPEAVSTAILELIDDGKRYRQMSEARSEEHTSERQSH